MRKINQIICAVAFFTALAMTSCSYFKYTYRNNRFSVCQSANGIWGDWKHMPFDKIRFLRTNEFVIYDCSQQPYEYAFRVVVNLSSERKRQDGWSEYNCSVEYYEDFLTGKFMYDWFVGRSNKQITNATILTEKPIAKLATGKAAGAMNVFFGEYVFGIGNAPDSY